MQMGGFSKYTERYALWRAYGAQCFYCGEPLLFFDMHVDHIIPKAILNGKEKYRRTLKEYDLPSEFSIDGLSNQVPCHSHCNLRKGAELF
jgi:5-methylcytosine-specific restriction endonuclease McrA